MPLKNPVAKIESVALSETYSSVTRLKVSKVRSEGCGAQDYRVTCRYKSRHVRRHSNFRFQAGAPAKQFGPVYHA